ncbi:MAG: hypothetical protein WCJ01_12145 [Ignavibacteria bacterium]
MRMVARGHRISFYISDDLSKKASDVAGWLNQTMSDFARNAIREAADATEKAEQERELAEGYKANYNYYLNQNREWEYADRSSDSPLGF